MFRPHHIDKTISQYIGRTANWLDPGHARRLIETDVRGLETILDALEFDCVIVGNKYHAPERILIDKARQRGMRVGLIEEGLSLYQTLEYWEPAILARAVRRLGYLYHNVGRYYGRPRQVFDFAYLSVPAAYPHNDVVERRPLRNEVAALRWAAESMLARSGARALVSELVPGAPLILSQRLTEDGLVAREDEIDALANAVQVLAKKDRPIYFKAHPRDSFDKGRVLAERFGENKVRLLPDAQVPVEILFASWRPSVVVGFISATLIYAPLIYDILAYSIADRLQPLDGRLDRFRGVLDACGVARLPRG